MDCNVEAPGFMKDLYLNLCSVYAVQNRRGSGLRDFFSKNVSSSAGSIVNALPGTLRGVVRRRSNTTGAFSLRGILVAHISTLSLLAGVPAQSQPTGSESEVQVVVSTQDAQGVTQRSFGPEFLKVMESYVVERTRVRANEYLASIGKPQQQVKLRSEATYIQSEGTKLIVIRVTDQTGRGAVTIAGIVGSELKRVVCTKASPGMPPISFGPCGRKAAEVFRVQL